MSFQAQKWTFSTIGALILAYSIIVLGTVATCPDLRIRTLISDDDLPEKTTHGVVVRSNDGMEYKGAKPQERDVVIRIGKADDKSAHDQIYNFLDYSRQLFALRNAKVPSGGLVHAGADPSEDPAAPWLVQYPDGTRWVAVEFLRPGDDEPHTSYVLIQSLPVGAVVLSYVWFVFQIGVFLFAALAFWNRPFDRTSRMFYVMCVVTLGAFVGGYHWWILGGRLWLNIPFALCAIMLPPVILHFFLVFPRPKQFLSNRPGVVLTAVYAVPCTVVLGSVVLLVSLRLVSAEDATAATSAIAERLHILRRGIYGYVYFAAVFFLFALISVRHSLANTRNPLERGQLRWIWHAGQFALICIGYTIWLVTFRRIEFAVEGAARVPMFLSSVSFMLAYSVGILRYRLMLVDQISGKGFLYYLVSGGLTVAFGLVLALAALAPSILNYALSQQQALTVAAVVMLGAILLLGMRDFIQQSIDRQFFREKYQLDQALERVNRAVGHLADPELLAEMMLGSCRDVLDVDHAALYLQSAQDRSYQLAACHESRAVPLHLLLEPETVTALQHQGSLQRVTPGSRNELTPIQSLLRQMNSDLVHALENGGEIIGLVFLGRKRNSASFTAEDVTFLNALGQITNVALHSAKVDRDLASLNDDLRLKSELIDEQKRQIALLQSEVTNSQIVPKRLTHVKGEQPELHRDAIKGNSAAIHGVLQTVQKVAGTIATVLVRGESGTGKELVAQVLHDNSPRRDGPFVRVHCAALSPGVLESELFGHVKGAFTGAHRDRPGRFELANGGTVFLDEIGDISPDTQVKLLRVLQERQFEPVGGDETRTVDVRLITATHRNLESLIASGQFREDLYYRLNVVSLTLPPLRDRHEDIYELALYFLNRSAERIGKRIRYFEDEALTALSRYSWPGNVRELENVIERAVVLSDDGRISLANLPDHVVVNRTQPRVRHAVTPTRRLESGIPRQISDDQPSPLSSTGPADDAQSAGEREVLQSALQECQGNKAAAARRLGMPRSTYFSKLKKYGIG